MIFKHAFSKTVVLQLKTTLKKKELQTTFMSAMSTKINYFKLKRLRK